MLAANMGLPLVCVTIPTMLIALFPIAWVEAFVYRSSLNVPRKQAFWDTVTANLWSTCIGIPLVWLPLVVGQLAIGGGRAWGIDTPEQRVQAVTLQAPWLIPYLGQTGWMVPAASLVLLLPFYLGSVVVEYLVLRERWRQAIRERFWNKVMLANAVSYAGLGLYYGAMLWVETRGMGP